MTILPEQRHLVPRAVVEAVILRLLHPPLPLAGFSIAMEREHQQNGSLADGYLCPEFSRTSLACAIRTLLPVSRFAYGT